jgi:DNA-directed RNA polymerase subunit RPC12/RpoP
MKDNKLIAEFMGAVGTPKYNPTEWDVYITGCLDVDSDDEKAQHFYTPDEMKYHTSWDWLMPVVDKCTQIGFRDTDTDDNPLYELWDRLFCDNMGQFVGNHIDEVYNSVVEFIKEYNKYICGSCGDHVNEVVFNEDTDVDECKNCTL